jgi:hypothetical protein
MFFDDEDEDKVDGGITDEMPKDDDKDEEEKM